MGGFRIEGALGNDAKVDAQGNLMVATSLVPANIGASRMYTENDAGNVTGVPFLMQPETSPDYKLRVGLDTLLFNDSFNTAAGIQNNNLWKVVIASSMTVASGAGALQFNANNTLTSGAGVAVWSCRYFPLIQTSPTYIEFSGYPTDQPLANQVVEFGLFLPTTGGVAPTEGAFFRYTSAGLYGVTNYNGVETQVLLQATQLTPNSQVSFIISCSENQTQFWTGSLGQSDILLGTIQTPAANGTPFMTYALPIAIQFRNNNLVTGSPVMQWKMSNVSVNLADFNTNKLWSHQMCGMGLNAAQGQNGHTSILSTASTAVTGAPAAAAALVQASVTAQFTGLGGIFRVLPTLTSGTEGLLCSYQNPAASINLTPRTLYITGCKIYSTVEVALTGGPLINVLQLLYGHTAVSAAVTTDTATAWATGSVKCPRRIPLGIEVYPAAAAVGAVANTNGLSLDLSQSPVVVNPGEFIAIGLRNQGTVTTAGNTLYTVTFTGYWE
jgi:hypothetical protein